MSTREDPGPTLETARSDIAVSRSLEDDNRSGPPKPRGAQLGALGVLVVGLLAAVVAAVLWGWGGDDTVVAKPESGSAAPAPAKLQPLKITADIPRAVTAGQPVDITVHYTDGSGVFGGTTEDWGEGVGTGSEKQGACSSGSPAASPLTGTYRLTHTWAQPGTYTVVLGVGSYTCRGAVAVEEQAAKTITLTVSPR